MRHRSLAAEPLRCPLALSCGDRACSVSLGRVGKWAWARAGLSLPGRRGGIILDAASWLWEDLLIILLIQGLS